MLHEFLTTNKADLIERCRLKVAERFAPKVAGKELAHGIPRFLDQLIKTLEVEQTSEPMRSRRVSGPSGGGAVVSEIAATAALHGRELSEQGFTVDQVVHDYGDLCQAITDLAFERGVPIESMNFELSTAVSTMASPMPSRNTLFSAILWWRAIASRP